MTRTALGIDLGSRTTKIVRVAGGRVERSEIFDTGHDPLAPLARALEAQPSADVTVATGYGRHLARARLDCRVVTEIRACARGAAHVGPGCGSVLDVGGQDTKAIELAAGGGFGRFEMNDRCAAGTGRFLEVMAGALGYDLETMATAAASADGAVALSIVCTVFAESEVVSRVARGEDRAAIARGLHIATARRIAAMASRLETGERMLFVGGVANNRAMVRALEDELDVPLAVPERPERVVALGAALIGLDDGDPSPRARGEAAT